MINKPTFKMGPVWQVVMLTEDGVPRVVLETHSKDKLDSYLELLIATNDATSLDEIAVGVYELTKVLIKGHDLVEAGGQHA